MKKITYLVSLFSVLMLFGCGTGEKEVYKEYKNYLTKNHIIEKVTYEKVLSLLDQEGEQIFYFGYASCPNCQAAIKYINNIAKNLGNKVIYYFDIKDIRTEDGEDYKNLIEKLNYKNENKTENGVARMPVPTILIRKDKVTLDWMTREYLIDEIIDDLNETDRVELVQALTTLYSLIGK